MSKKRKQKEYEVQPYTKNILPRNKKQEEFIKALVEYPIIFGVGSAGTGKTFLSVVQAIREYEIEAVNRILLVRPAVTTEKLGYLPGNLDDKLDPFMRPLFDAFHQRWAPKRIDSMMEYGEIELASLAYMRGRTFNNCALIFDEAQNSTIDQMKMLLTRLGDNVKCMINGDPQQTDISGTNGLVWAVQKLENCSSVSIVKFDKKDVVRSELTKQLVHYLEA